MRMLIDAEHETTREWIVSYTNDADHGQWEALDNEESARKLAAELSKAGWTDVWVSQVRSTRTLFGTHREA